RHEAVVGAEVVAVISVFAVEVLRLRRILIPEKSGVRLQSLSVPLAREIGTIGRARVAEEELSGERVVIVLPLKIGTDDAVVRAAGILTHRGENADVRVLADVVALATDERERREILIGEIRSLRRRKNGSAA